MGKEIPIPFCIIEISLRYSIVRTIDMISYSKTLGQGLSQDLQTGCPKLAIGKYLGIQIFKGDHNKLRF